MDSSLHEDFEIVPQDPCTTPISTLSNSSHSSFVTVDSHDVLLEGHPVNNTDHCPHELLVVDVVGFGGFLLSSDTTTLAPVQGNTAGQGSAVALTKQNAEHFEVIDPIPNLNELKLSDKDDNQSVFSDGSDGSEDETHDMELTDLASKVNHPVDVTARYYVEYHEKKRRVPRTDMGDIQDKLVSWQLGGQEESDSSDDKDEDEPEEEDQDTSEEEEDVFVGKRRRVPSD